MVPTVFCYAKKKFSLTLKEYDKQWKPLNVITNYVTNGLLLYSQSDTVITT